MAMGHHVLYEHWGWEAKGKNGVIRPAQRLRRMSGLIVGALYNTPEHTRIHNEITHVPVPGYLLSSAILQNYKDNPDDNLKSVHNFIEATHYAIERPRTTPFEKELGDLIIRSVEAQIPYIEAVL